MSTASNKIRTDDNAPATHKVASAAHDAIDSAAKKAEPVEQQLRDQASKAGEQMEATQAAAVKQVEDSMQKIEKFVRERPVAATGLAFAAGALATIILRR
jgi:ElaB/YqjD/DUF883 family membrane-anchored ribosome-binding protein